ARRVEQPEPVEKGRIPVGRDVGRAIRDAHRSDDGRCRVTALHLHPHFDRPAVTAGRREQTETGERANLQGHPRIVVVTVFSTALVTFNLRPPVPTLPIKFPTLVSALRRTRSAMRQELPSSVESAARTSAAAPATIGLANEVPAQ